MRARKDASLLVTLSGGDLSGKSTQVELLAMELRSTGHDVVTVWHRPGYSPRLDRTRSAVRRFRPGILPEPEDVDARTQVFARPAVRRAWLIGALLDTLYEYIIKTRCLLAVGKTVVFDRYLEDALLDLEIKFPELKSVASSVLRWISSLAPRPDASLLLILPWEAVMARSELKKEPFPDSPETRRRRLLAYELMAHSGRFQVIDASAPTEEVHSEIVRYVRALGNHGGGKPRRRWR